MPISIRAFPLRSGWFLLQHRLHHSRSCLSSLTPEAPSQFHLLWNYLLVRCHRSRSLGVGYISALFFAKPLTKKCGRLPSLISVYLLLAIEVLIFGLAKQCRSDELFLALSIFARVCEGLATSFTTCTLLAMIPSYYEAFSSYISVTLLGIQMAELLGPLWGGLLFNPLGYTGIFLVQSLSILVTALMMCYFRRYERAHPLLQIQEDDQVGYCKLLTASVSSYHLREFSSECWCSWLQKASTCRWTRSCPSSCLTNLDSKSTTLGSSSSILQLPS